MLFGCMYCIYLRYMYLHMYVLAYIFVLGLELVDIPPLKGAGAEASPLALDVHPPIQEEEQFH